ncbi:hypothetical protein F511_30253 [Dorcoceras hygrometricum]|uniref:Dystroglycan-like n=1 Tax=Dorcoceras hygrometricum TaxID=472368 RepID=A0A2Z7DKW9_9LAMI|nr:hypothetical protein F511_30253 [Dorcoceras hygrometricum]
MQHLPIRRWGKCDAGGDLMRDAHVDVPSSCWLRAQLAFKDSMVHGIRKFTPSYDIDPFAGSRTKTMLQLLLPLNDKVQWTSRYVAGSEPPTSERSEHFTGPFNRVLIGIDKSAEAFFREISRSIISADVFVKRRVSRQLQFPLVQSIGFCDREEPAGVLLDDNQQRDDRYKRDDRRADDRYKKEERYRRDEESDEKAVDRSKDKFKKKSKERSKDRRMRTSSNKKPSRRHDRKVLVAEESTKSWADSDSDSSSISSSSSDSEQEEVHCFMADQTSDDEVFDFSNVEFTREDLVQALNDMVHEYKTLSHTFEEIKAENSSLKNSSAESSSDELEDTDSLKTEMSKLKIENDLLRNEASELKAEVDKLTKEMSSWNQSTRSLHKLNESLKQVYDKSGIGFSSGECSEEETSTQSQLGFLGCPVVVYEDALVEFFDLPVDGLVVSTVNGVAVNISEKLFAETFDLPVDGLADISEMSKDKIFDARSIVSLIGEPVTLSGLKSQMKMHYRLLCDIMEKSISVKAGSFNAITVEKFSFLTVVVCDVKMNWGCILFGFLKKMVTPGTNQAKGFAIQISLLLESIPNLELGASSEFPSSKILTDKTIHRYIAVINKSGAQDPADAPKIKKAPKTKVASRKRPVDIPLDVPVVKRKRTSKKKSTLKLVAVAQEAIPIQIVPAESVVEPMVEDQQTETEDAVDRPAAEEETPADRPADEIVNVEQRVDESAVEVSGVDVDRETVIQHVLNQLDLSTEGQDVTKGDKVETWFDRALAEEIATAGGDSPTEKANDEIPWFVRPFLSTDHDSERLFETGSDSASAMDFEVHCQNLPVVKDAYVDPAGEQEISVFEKQLVDSVNEEEIQDKTVQSAEAKIDKDETISLTTSFCLFQPIFLCLLLRSKSLRLRWVQRSKFRELMRSYVTWPVFLKLLMMTKERHFLLKKTL